MKDISDFLTAALPWICMGLLLAVFFAKNAGKKKEDKKKETYSTEGMLAGLVIGSCIEKKKDDDGGHTS